MNTRLLSGTLTIALLYAGSIARGTDPVHSDVDTSEWHIGEAYKYSGTFDDGTPDETKRRFAQFFIDCQDPDTGTFRDKHGNTYYSVKIYNRLKALGAKPKYPLAVCQDTDAEWCTLDGEPITEQTSPEDFRRWLDKIRRIENAYAAGSSMGHFISPHVINLENAGRSIEDSPFIPVFRQWLLNNQGENGFWNRPDDPDFNGWNGIMKMDEALRSARIELPRQDRMIRTVLKSQDPKDGNFTAAGGCTNHNALHTLRQWSKRWFTSLSLSESAIWASVSVTCRSTRIVRGTLLVRA